MKRQGTAPRRMAAFVLALAGLALIAACKRDKPAEDPAAKTPKRQKLILEIDQMASTPQVPSRCARSTASATDPSEEYLDGIETPVTFSDPRASTAIAPTRAESMPPESATKTWSNPVLRT